MLKAATFHAVRASYISSTHFLGSNNFSRPSSALILLRNVRHDGPGNTNRNYWANESEAYLEAKVISEGDISEDDILIGLLGPTGAGKSSFINKATGYKDGIGHSLHSCTDKITAIKCRMPEIADRDIVFVDTPGFDDSRFTEKVVLEMISTWLHDRYKRNIKLNGLLYFHKISDNRMGRSSISHIDLFHRIVGKNFQNIVLVSTMWDEVDSDEGEKRENQLREEYWKWLIKQGSKVARSLHSQASALLILKPVVDNANAMLALQIHEEIENFNGELAKTEAGKALSIELQTIFRRHRDALEKIRNELERPNLTDKVLRQLIEEYRVVSAELKTLNKQLQTMTIPDRIQNWLQRAMAQRNFFRFFDIFRFGATKRLRTMPAGI
ncbi:P-loop containing nucleoside triphosphate hydrolase protein [Crepidotus variabilis]|uniref:P-loop containing nucleoside triphosphate hydrolase protein n=1 Tax=Crepidotus variabilis TaxID=179855 RepID=A0A9P6ED76_9AGAR|nr:P-loop containing nucleoside triphosphate hydrolase protein [Crepidotus variabilis]